jgi:hypothetical protein
MIHGSASTSPNPDFVLLESEYSGDLVCQECEEDRSRVDALVDIGDLVSSLRELGWEDVAELVIRRKLSPADRLFRKFGEFVADELAAQHSTAVRPGIPSVPGGTSLPGRGL